MAEVVTGDLGFSITDVDGNSIDISNVGDLPAGTEIKVIPESGEVTVGHANSLKDLGFGVDANADTEEGTFKFIKE